MIEVFHKTHESQMTHDRRLAPVDSRVALETLLAASSEQPVLILKHSRTCGVSAQAFDEMETYLNEHAAAPRAGVIVVQSHRELSAELARILDIRHETPQVVLVKNGRVVWHASHFRVRREAIAEAVESASLRQRH